MPWFPTEAARDLVGLLRAMYLVERGKAFPSEARMKLLVELGRELLDADLEARKSAPGSMVYLESIRRADAVVARLGDLLTGVEPAMPVLEVAGARIRRAADRRWLEKRLVGSNGRKGRG